MSSKKDRKKAHKAKRKRDESETAVSSTYDLYTPHRKTVSMSAEKASKYRERKKITVSVDGFNPVTSFKRTGMPEALVKAATSGFKKPSPVQAQAFPILLSGRDVIAVAATGSGKTLAFSLPGMVHCASRGPPSKKLPWMLVLSPTRELALQTHKVCESAGKSIGVSSVCIFGGVSKGPQISALRKGVSIVVATPGRLLDLMQDGYLSLECVSFVVLDEADRMLDMGFAPDLARILPLTMSSRQTAMFSATWPKEVQTLASRYLRPTCPLVTIGSNKTGLKASADVQQIIRVMQPWQRDAALKKLLEEIHRGKGNKVLVFVLYKREAGQVEQMLKRVGYNVAAIHGDLSQQRRDSVLADFRSGACPMMVATDVAARGLDVQDIAYVINYSFPLKVEDYVHRVGRTGRAGNSGIAYTFFTENAKQHAGALIGVLKKSGCEYPADLLQWGTATKKAKHALYGDHYRDDITKEKTHVIFDSSSE